MDRHRLIRFRFVELVWRTLGGVSEVGSEESLVDELEGTGGSFELTSNAGFEAVSSSSAVDSTVSAVSTAA